MQPVKANPIGGSQTVPALQPVSVHKVTGPQLNIGSIDDIVPKDMLQEYEDNKYVIELRTKRYFELPPREGFYPCDDYTHQCSMDCVFWKDHCTKNEVVKNDDKESGSTSNSSVGHSTTTSPKHSKRRKRKK